MSRMKSRKRLLWLLPLSVALILILTLIVGFAVMSIAPKFYRETLPWYSGLTLGMSPEEAQRLLGEATTSEVHDDRSMSDRIELHETRDFAENCTLICIYHKFGSRYVLKEAREKISFATEEEAQAYAEATATLFRVAWQDRNLFRERVTENRMDISWSRGPTLTSTNITVDGTSVSVRCETNEFFR